MAGKHRKTEASSFSITVRLWASGLLLIMGLMLGLYSPAAQWLSDREHSQLLMEAQVRVSQTAPSERSTALEQARHYNDEFARGNIPFDYEEQLNLFGDGQMARVRIPSINVDLPVYHGTSDDVLRRGAGHMGSTSLPVGGESSHSAVSAHNGLPSSVLFTNLEEVQEGELFYIDVLGETLTYRVVEITVVKPDEAEFLRISPGKDLVTLITCTPTGINEDRLLVSGERVIDDVGEIAEVATPVGPGFPWWLVIGAGGVICIVSGTIYVDVKRRKQ